MSNPNMHDDPCLSWRTVADVEGISLIEQCRFRLLLRRGDNAFHLRLQQQKGSARAGRISWMPIMEITGNDAQALLARGRAIAYAQLADDGDYIDWDDEINPALYPTPYCYICDAHGIDCLLAEEA